LTGIQLIEAHSEKGASEKQEQWSERGRTSHQNQKQLTGCREGSWGELQAKTGQSRGGGSGRGSVCALGCHCLLHGKVWNCALTEITPRIPFSYN